LVTEVIDPVLALDDVHAGYGGGDVLHGLSLSIEAGSVTCVVGPNGAGKSTVLRVVTGLLRPRAGDVRFQGIPITGLSPRAILRLGVVHVPQERSLFPRMSVLENVRLGGYILGRHELVEERLRQVRAAFPIVDERAGELARNLSGGQQKLVEFARAMMLEPWSSKPCWR
jgi:branched-chain amino acid transport system ATP-binding protein